MKNVIITACMAVTTWAAGAQIKMPAPSPMQSMTQDFAMGNIEVKYSRPAAKERTVFGDLVPYGKLWRTGANGATIVKFNQPVEILGKKVDTGSYALYTVPGVENWEVILNKGTSNWGVDGYAEADDVIRVKVSPEKLKTDMENFTILFDNVKPESIDMWLVWAKTGVRIPIQTSIKDKLRGQVEKAMMAEKKPYWMAAQFYHDYDKNYAKALENINKAVDENPKAFYMVLYKARIQKQMGDIEGARTSSKKSLELSKAAKNDDYVKLNEEFMKTLK